MSSACCHRPPAAGRLRFLSIGAALLSSCLAHASGAQAAPAGANRAARLSERARQDREIVYLLRERFGLTGKTPMTLEEVGREFGVTRERIRQLQNVALTKMRKALRRKDKPLPKPLAEGLQPT